MFELFSFFYGLESASNSIPLKTQWNTVWFEKFARDPHPYSFTDDKWLGNPTKEVQYFTDDETFIFSMPMIIQDQEALKSYFAKYIPQPYFRQKTKRKSFQSIIGFAQTILIGTQDGFIYRSKNDERLEHISTMEKGFRLELMLNDDVALATNKNKKLFRSRDAGASWELVSFPRSGSLSEIAMLDKNLVFVQWEGQLLISKNLGLNWETIEFNTEHISCFSPSLIFRYGRTKTILRSDDDGHNTIIIRGTDNQIFYTKNLGKTWQPFPWLTHEPIRTIFADQGYAITRTGSLIKYDITIGRES